jgi:hypothetical protein
MAMTIYRNNSTVAFTLGLLSLLALGTGCQSSKPMVAQLPPPAFEGPKIVHGSAAPPPVASSGGGGVGAPLSSSRDWTPRVPARPWKWIVIHHSASPTGSMAVFDKEHKAKGWDGVGYHFVIGNGTNSGDGQIEVTPRWPIQKWGAHAKTIDNRFNEYGIGICMVGNFDVNQPTQNQMRSLNRLVAYLMQTYHIPASNVLGHRDTKPTDCPGRFVNVAAIRQQAARTVAVANGATASDVDATVNDPAKQQPVELLTAYRP